MRAETTADPIPDDLSRQATAWLVQLADDSENEALRMEFVDWLATSPAHRAAWEETRRASDLIGLAGRLSEDIPVQTASLSRRGRFRTIRHTRAFTALALSACLAWIVVPHLVLRFRSDAITGTSELRLVKLADGSTVQLAPATAIAFVNDAAHRTVTLLQGEAWFDVVHDETRPFRVRAGDHTVTDVGTAFSVRRLAGRTDVAVQRGRVAVNGSDGTGPDGIELAAGQSLSLSQEGEAIRDEIRPDRVASWREGLAIIDDEPIADVIDRIRPWYGGFIIARGPGLQDRRLSGIYDLRDPDLALKALTRVQKVRVSKVSPWLRIVTVG